MDTGLIVLIEVIIIAGGVLAFGLWQIRSVRRDSRKAEPVREDGASGREASASRSDS
jgi:hypothetical protein